MRIKKPFVQKRMAVNVVQRITPTILATIMKTPFGFGPSKSGVTPGGGVFTEVAARNDARLANDVVVVAEAAIVDVVGMTDDILGMADGEMKWR